MKKFLIVPISIVCLQILVSCTPDSIEVIKAPEVSTETNLDFTDNIFFAFVTCQRSNNYYNMPIDTSATNLFVGRWKIIKIGVDANNDGNIKFYNYEDYKHKECKLSFLQFNNDGVVYENAYYNDQGN